MLSCGGNKKELTPEEKEAIKNSRAIDGGIKKEKDQLAFKLLLLVFNRSNAFHALKTTVA